MFADMWFKADEYRILEMIFYFLHSYSHTVYTLMGVYKFVSIVMALNVQQIHPETFKKINNLILVIFASVSLWIYNVHDFSLHSVHTSISAMCLPFIFTSKRLPLQILCVIHILVMMVMSCFILLTCARVPDEQWAKGG